MTWTEQMLAAVENSGAEAGRKAVAAEFLKTAGPMIETLGPSVIEGILRAAAGGGVPEVAVQSLDSRQVAKMLGVLESEMSALVEKHEAEKVAWKAATAQLQAAALSAVARIIVAIL